nr:MAG TPA: hypothetical protein [Caudoviricetes sp.]
MPIFHIPVYTPSPAVMVGEGVWGYDVFIFSPLNSVLRLRFSLSYD